MYLESSALSPASPLVVALSVIIFAFLAFLLLRSNQVRPTKQQKQPPTQPEILFPITYLGPYDIVYSWPETKPLQLLILQKMGKPTERL